MLPGRVAAFGCTDAASGTERLIVLAETRKRDEAEVARLHAEINDRVAVLAGAPPDEVVLAPPNSIPRTSSGKIRRGAARDLWRDGRLGQAERSRRSEALRLAVAAGAVIPAGPTPARRATASLMPQLLFSWSASHTALSPSALSARGRRPGAAFFGASLVALLADFCGSICAGFLSAVDL